MSTYDDTGNQASGTSIDDLPPAIGVDAAGRTHHVSAQFATHAFVRDGRGAVHSFDLDGRTRADWREHVGRAVGWRDEWTGERLTPIEIERRIAAARGEA
jgi:hypothetical protein